MSRKDIPNYEGLYQASTDGEIYSLERFVDYRIKGYKRLQKGRKLKPRTNKRGYLRLTLCKNGLVKDFSVHVLIALTFLGSRPNGYHVAHKDGNKKNNSLLNLAFVTPKENESHKKLHGTVASGKKNGKYTNPSSTPRGEQHGQAKLKESEVRVIKTSKESCLKLAKKYGVSKTAILAIKHNKIWKHV